MKVGIIGAEGYVGMELNRLLASHPEVSELISYSPVDDLHKFSSVNPGIWSDSDINCVMGQAEEIAGSCDFVFTALPSGLSLKYAEIALAAGAVLIDMGADFRFDDFSVYNAAYGCYENNNLLDVAVYGLPEIKRSEIVKSKIIGNPGCFPTSVILALMPLLKEGLLSDAKIIVDAKSGATGAGRKKETDYLFCEINENISAYKPFNHRHVPEIEQELNKLSLDNIKLVFNPHLLPLNRGMMSSIYVEVDRKCNEDLICSAYSKHYCGEPFVRVLAPGRLPQIKWVQGSNLCMIGFQLDTASSTLLVVSVIDNLIKGAAGQAVQNMNILLGCSETCGLTASGLYF